METRKKSDIETKANLELSASHPRKLPHRKSADMQSDARWDVQWGQHLVGLLERAEGTTYLNFIKCYASMLKGYYKICWREAPSIFKIFQFLTWL